jgi:5-hydroxyisourate hydrolase
MTVVSTHVLDSGGGRPAAGMRVSLARRGADRWVSIAEGATDSEGRIGSLAEVEAGTYRLGFETGEWGNPLYPFVHVVFEIEEGRAHIHVPLLLSPYGYTTYRGS